jgi:hypothetical protein
MRRSDLLITAVRNLSRNAANPDGTFSITDDEILQYLNDGQDRLQNLLSAEKNIAKIFCTESVLSAVAGQEAYTIPDRVLMNKQIEFVEYSATGAVADYVRVEKLNFFNRDTNQSTYPWGYIKRGGQLLIQPTFTTAQGSIRVTYERELDDLDAVRGRVNGTPAGLVIDLTHSTGAPTAANEALFVNGTYVCVSSVSGSVLLYNGLISSYDAPTDAITLAANVSTYLVTGVALADLADGYLTVGKYTTTFSKLPDNCERYLIHYAAAELFHRDSSNDYNKELGLLGEIEKDIIKSLSAQTSEVQFVPQMNRFEWW